MTLYLKADVRNASPDTYEHKKHLIMQELELFLRARPNLVIELVDVVSVDNSTEVS